MKKNIRIFMSLVLVSLASLLVSSCCDGEGDAPVVKKMPVQRIEVPGGSFGFTTGDNKNSYVIFTDDNTEDGALTNIYVRPNNPNGKPGFIKIDDGKVSSVTIGDVTYTFVDNDGVVDVAIAAGGNTELIQEVAKSDDIWNAPTTGSMGVRLAGAFSTYEQMLALIKILNGQIGEDSPIYPYVHGNGAATDQRGSDSGIVTDPTNMTGVVEPGVTVVIPQNPIDKEEMDEDKKQNDEDTDSSHAALVSGSGALKVTVSWKFSADIDSYVIEPRYSGSTGVIWYSQPHNSFCGGMLDIDNTVGYYINPQTRVSYPNLAAVENIYYESDVEPGVYNVKLNYYGGQEDGPVTVVIYANGKSIGSRVIEMKRAERAIDGYRAYVSVGTVKMPEGVFTPVDGISTSITTRANAPKLVHPAKK